MKLAVGGMIASGKSTLVRQLAEEYSYDMMDEFSADDEVFNTLLGWLYEGKPDVEMLLQTYFLYKHYTTQLKFPDDVVVDRHIIEHWLFAQENLKEKPTVKNMYNGMFHQFMNHVTQPDLYIILDLDWDTFMERIKKRGRKQEIDNLDDNEKYFRQLLVMYKDKLEAQCKIYDIPYVVVDTTYLDDGKVLGIVKKKIEDFFGKDLTKH
mgnify:CR=1 FL=1